MQVLERIQASPGHQEAPRQPRPQIRNGSGSRSYSAPAAADRTHVSAEASLPRVPDVTPNLARREDYLGSFERARMTTSPMLATPKISTGLRRPKIGRATSDWTIVTVQALSELQDARLRAQICIVVTTPLKLQSAALAKKVRPTLPLPRADVARWFSECLEPEHPALQVLPPEAARQHGAARVAQVNGSTLILLPRPGTSTPERKQTVERYVASGLDQNCTVLVRQSGKLRRITALGRSLPVPNGLYTCGVDQSARLITGVSPNRDSSAALSAKRGVGAPGNHAHLTAMLPGLFFGELEVQGDEVVAYNNRTGTYLTPPELAPQAQAHPLLAKAKFYPCCGE